MADEQGLPEVSTPAEQPAPQDYTNQEISSPYMGNINPDKVLQSPDASSEAKLSALDILQKKQSDQESQKTQEAQQAVAEKAKAFDAWQKSNETYDALAERAKSLGKEIALPARPTPDKFGLSMDDVASLSNPTVQQQIVPALQQQAQQKQQSQNLQDQQSAAIAGAKKAVTEQSTIQGYMAQQDRIAQHQQQLMDESIKAVDDKQYELDKIDPNRFWNNMSGGQKVLGTLAIALGEIGRSRVGGSNVGLDMINKSIDRDIEAQKWSNQQKIAMKQNALKRVQLEIEKYGQLSRDNDKKLQMNLLASQLQQQQDTIKQQQAQTIALNKQLNSGGLPPDQFNLMVTDKEQLKKAVTLPNGNITVASVEPTQEDRKMLLDKTNGIKMLKQYQDMVNNMSMADRINPYSPVHEQINNLRLAIGGLMHTDLVGPGPYTEQKQKKVDEILGSTFATTPSLFNARINGLVKLQNTAVKGAYNSIGIKMPNSPADALRQKLQSMGKYTPEAIESAVQQAAKKDPKYAE